MNGDAYYCSEKKVLKYTAYVIKIYHRSFTRRRIDPYCRFTFNLYMDEINLLN